RVVGWHSMAGGASDGEVGYCQKSRIAGNEAPDRRVGNRANEEGRDGGDGGEEPRTGPHPGGPGSDHSRPKSVDGASATSRIAGLLARIKSMKSMMIRFLGREPEPVEIATRIDGLTESARELRTELEIAAQQS